MAKLAFIIVILHMSVIGFAWWHYHLGETAYQALFFGSFLQVSPIMVLFTLMSLLGVDYGGRFSSLIIFGAAFCLIKYGVLIISLKQEGLSYLNILTCLIEAVYVGTSGWYLTQLNIL